MEFIEKQHIPTELDNVIKLEKLQQHRNKLNREIAKLKKVLVKAE